eukprot:gene394-414_t
MLPPSHCRYGATKSFVSQFAASLAVEVRAMGIDVLAVHPSPVASNFFDKVHKLESLELAQKSAVSPSSVPYKILSCIGRSHVGDLGSMATTVRTVWTITLTVSVTVCLDAAVVAIVPYDFLTGVFSFFAPYLGDYQRYNKVLLLHVGARVLLLV